MESDKLLRSGLASHVPKKTHGVRITMAALADTVVADAVAIGPAVVEAPDGTDTVN